MSNYNSWSDAELRVFARDYAAMIALSPTTYGLTTELSNELTSRSETYADLLAEVENPATRGGSKIYAKNEARRVLIDFIRLTGNLIQATPTVTNQQRYDLGLPIHDHEPTPPVIPTVPPSTSIAAEPGRRVRVRVRDVNGVRRRKPPGIKGVTVFSHVGPTPPSTLSEWKFEGSSTKTNVYVQFPNSVPAGAQVWITAHWFNSRSQTGPVCPALTTNLVDGAVAQQSA